MANHDMVAKELQANTLLSDKLKNEDAVLCLIEYFQDNRANSLEDAINLYFEEQHRSKLENFMQQQIQLTAEAAESARLAAESAREAAELAQEAIDRANEAYGRADDAYRKIEDINSDVTY